MSEAGRLGDPDALEYARSPVPDVLESPTVYRSRVDCERPSPAGLICGLRAGLGVGCIVRSSFHSIPFSFSRSSTSTAFNPEPDEERSLSLDARLVGSSMTVMGRWYPGRGRKEIDWRRFLESRLVLSSSRIPDDGSAEV